MSGLLSGSSRQSSDVLVDLASANGATEAELLRLHPGQTAELSPTAAPAIALAASVTQVEPVVSDGRFALWLKAHVRHERVFPGGTCRVRVTLEEKHDALSVPADAVRREGGQAYLDVWKDGALSPRRVEVGATSEGRAEILDGVEAGETVKRG